MDDQSLTSLIKACSSLTGSAIWPIRDKWNSEPAISSIDSYYTPADKSKASAGSEMNQIVTGFICASRSFLLPVADRQPCAYRRTAVYFLIIRSCTA